MSDGKNKTTVDHTCYKFQYKEWEENPEVIPKGSYFEHDSRSRDDMNFWERKQIFLKTGRYPGERGGFRGRGNSRGFGRGFNRGSGFTRGYNRGGFTPRGRGLPRYNPRDGRGGISVFKGRVPFKGASSSMDEWKHDKFSEIEGEESGSQDDKTSKNDKSGDKKERKSHHHKDKKDKVKKRKDKETRKDIKNEQNDNKERNTNDIRKEEEALESELSVEVTV